MSLITPAVIPLILFMQDIEFCSDGLSCHTCVVLSPTDLIKSEATVACPCNVAANVFTTRHIGPSTLAAVGEQLAVVPAPVTGVTGNTEIYTGDLNSSISSFLDSVPHLPTKTRRREIHPHMSVSLIASVLCLLP